MVGFGFELRLRGGWWVLSLGCGFADELGGEGGLGDKAGGEGEGAFAGRRGGKRVDVHEVMR